MGFRSSDPLIRFAIFNAYGEPTDRDKVRGIPVLMPKNLPEIFGLPVFEAFQELHRVVQSVVVENEVFRPYSQGTDLPKIERLLLDAIEETRSETPKEFRGRIGAALDRLTHEQTA